MFLIALKKEQQNYKPIPVIRKVDAGIIQKNFLSRKQDIEDFLIFNSLVIGLLWLSIVVPPLIDGTVIPLQVEHYTTLIVQALDLGILLPAAFISGILIIRKTPLGYLIAPIYFVFLALLMTALTSKILAMKIFAYNVIPAIFIIPAFNLITIVCTIIIFKNIKENATTQYK